MKTLLTLVLQHAGAQRVILLTRDGDELTVTAESDADGTMTIGHEVDRATPYVHSAVADAMRTNEPLLIEDAGTSDRYGHDPDVAQRSVRSVMVLPIVHSGASLGVLYLENNLTSNAFTSERAGVIRLLIGHVAVALENARLYDAQQRLLDATARFVPAEFLHHLGERSIGDITSGMAVRLPMTVLFADIRRFTTISESLPTDATFSFLNAYLRLVEPIIRAHDGFIDKYIGDAVMALFPGSPADAVHAAVEIQRALEAFNADRATNDLPDVTVGIGIHHGDVILGTVGSVHRMDTTVIGDTVNVASRLEHLTKERGLGIVISDEVRQACPTNGVTYEPIGSAAIRGRSQPVLAYEVRH
jgi:class 3 adenylate cyclase